MTQSATRPVAESVTETFAPIPRQRINQKRLRELRLSRHVAARQVARDCGMEIATYNRLETGDDPALSLLTVAALQRIADYLRIPIGDLFTPSTDPDVPVHDDPTSEPEKDTQTLGALLNSLATQSPVVAICDSLGWTQERTHATIKTLTTLLEPAGLTVYQFAGRVVIRPLADTHTDAELAYRQHPRASHSQRLIAPARARMVYRATQEPLSAHSMTTGDKVHLTTLVKAGILIEDDQRRYVPSPEVAFSLDPINNRPPATGERGTSTANRSRYLQHRREATETPPTQQDSDLRTPLASNNTPTPRDSK